MKEKLILEYINQDNHQTGLKPIFEECFKNTVKVLNKNESYRVSLTLVNEEEIHTLNKQYRNIDRPTDVLTFAFLEADVLDLEDEVVDLGNIIICPEVALRQASEYSHPYKRELAFLFIHGLLHSFGYDHHRSDEEAKEMFDLQNLILNTLNYDFYTNISKVKKLLLDAQSKSYSPYSKFRVGAVTLTKDNKYHIGFNIENSAYGDSMCAERVAMFHTYALGYKKDDIVSLSLITDDKNIGTPCGSCRQVMMELLNPYTRIHIFNNDESKELHTSVSELLPFAFTGDDLK